MDDHTEPWLANLHRYGEPQPIDHLTAPPRIPVTARMALARIVSGRSTMVLGVDEATHPDRIDDAARAATGFGPPLLLVAEQDGGPAADTLLVFRGGRIVSDDGEAVFVRAVRDA